jgi:hypothetical protein
MYLVGQLNPQNQQALRRLRCELPDRFNVDNGLEEGRYRVWVSYPERDPLDGASAVVRHALTKLGITGIDIAEP